MNTGSEGPVASVLARVSLFAGMDAAARAELARTMARVHYGQGELVVQHMDDSRDLYIVISGNLIATIISPEGREVAFDLMTSGDYFGEIAALDGGPRSASVSALTDAEVCSIPASRFRTMVAENPAVNEALIKDFIARIRRLTERNYENIALRIKHRVQLELLRLAHRSGVLYDNGVLSPAPTHAQIAARIGANREAVTRELSALTKRGLIRSTRQTIIILDAMGLIDEADADIELDDPILPAS